jgi:magnesium transporter
MPSLPRIRRTRARDTVVTASAPQSPPAELSAAGLTWIHLDAPSLTHAQELADRFGWHPLDVEDVMSKRQRPKVDDYADEGYLFGVLHFPVYDRAIQRLNAAELDVFVGPDYLVTLPTVELFDYCFPILDKIGHKLDSLEDDVFEGRSEAVVRDISNVKQEIISYRKIIKPERSTLRVLERHVERFLPEELELYFDDIVDAAERIWDILDNYKEVVEALEDTNESVIQHRQNDVLRILTVFSVVLLPLTLITGFFGMNVHFPGFGTVWAFWTVFVGMVVMLVALLAFFRLKRWL